MREGIDLEKSVDGGRGGREVLRKEGGVGNTIEFL